MMTRLSGEKVGAEQEHDAVLNERYDLSDRPAQGVTMDRGKPVQEGVSGQITGRGHLGQPGGDEPRPDP